MIGKAGFHTTSPRLQLLRRPGALRGGFTGFLFGTAATGALAYYYLLDQYTAGQQAILRDVVELRESLRDMQQRIDAVSGSQCKCGDH